jgi:hypothetical protein
MIGSARGIMVSTNELKEEVAATDVFVIVDGEQYLAHEVKALDSGDAAVVLVPQFGEAWDLEVGKGDLDEPLWEVDGQS